MSAPAPESAGDKLRRTARWLNSSSQGKSTQTLTEARRQAWVHTGAAAFFVLVALMALPFEGRSDYIRLLFALLFVGVAIGSWFLYRVKRSDSR